MSDVLKPAILPGFFTLFVILTSFCFGQTVYGAATYEDYRSKGDRNLKIIERLYFKYPLASSKRKIAFNLLNNWNSILLQYPEADRNERKRLYGDLKQEYVNSNTLLRDISIELAGLFEQTYNILAKQMIDIELSTTEFSDAQSRLRIAKQEFHRAETGYRNRQFYYSSHLFDRAITMLLNIYNSLQWKLPEPVRGVIL